MDIPDALALYKECCHAILELLQGRAKEAHYQGKGYTMQDLDTLREYRKELKIECEGAGLIDADPATSKIAVAQAWVNHPQT